MRQSRQAHEAGAFLTRVEQLSDQQRRFQNPEIYESLEQGPQPRRSDLLGRLGHSAGLTLLGGGNPFVDGAIGMLRGGAAFSESVNENLALAVLGHSDQADRQSNAFFGCYVEGSFFTQVAVGREQFDIDMIGFIREQSTGQVVTDEELRLLEAGHPQLTQNRDMLSRIQIHSERLDPRHRELGRTAAPFIDQVLMTLATLPVDGPALIGALRGLAGARVLGTTAIRTETGVTTRVLVEDLATGRVVVVEQAQGARVGQTSTLRILEDVPVDGTRLSGAAADSRSVWSSAAGDVVIAGDSLPGRTGLEVSRRLTTVEMQALQQAHGAEFALVYEVGTGPSGGGGRYLIFSGGPANVYFPPSGSYI